MAAVRAVVFDLDGTLIDSRLDIAHAANAALVRAGRTALDPAEIATYVGDGARRLMQRAARVAADDPGLDRLLEDFLRAYEAAATPHTHRMPGAERALTALAHLPLAVCTNKPRRTTDIVLGELGLGPHFRAVVAGGDLPVHKPDPAVLRHTAALLGVEPAELVMVGDGPQDVECGRAVAARTVGVKGGIVPLERLVAAEPDVLLDSLAELPDWIERWQAASR
ncbi:MAG TPA: HAD-IA family hydrolase [Polyangiaceae bacterium]|nr:HAD-IA family hydrolase [Polyangiaceae bacterium]